MIPPESPAAPSPQGDAASGRAEPVPRRHAHGLLRGLLNFQAPTGDARLLFGFWLGVLGVTCFAITLPATRLATGTAADPQLSPAFVTAGRAALAGLLSAAFLLIARSPWPTGAQWRALSLSMAGNVIADPKDLSTMPHIDYVREAGSEGIELVMWLIARGAMADVAGGLAPTVRHRFFHVPASNTAVGHLIMENQA